MSENNAFAKDFLNDEVKKQHICDAVITKDEFREFCNAFSISPTMRLKLCEKEAEKRVPEALSLWYASSPTPTVSDLRDALKKWKHFALLHKLALDE